MKIGEFLHRNCRNAIYPQSNVFRFPVPDNLVNWCENFADYTPVFHESPSIAGKPFADPPIDDSLFTPKWHTIDRNVDRSSFHGNYKIQNRLPLNPFGRTGIVGRGLLGRYAVNHAADPIVTKWKRNTDGKIVNHMESGKKILQMVVIQRRDNQSWAIPGGMVDPGEQVTKTLKREFTEEALNSKQSEKLDDFFDSNGTQIYCGYVDDPRNTDNAWIETVATNFHDEIGKILADIKLEAGDDAGNTKWIDIDGTINLYANHKHFIELVAQKHDAHF